MDSIITVYRVAVVRTMTTSDNKSAVSIAGLLLKKCVQRGI